MSTIKSLLDYSLGLWKNRCEALHGADEVEGRKTRREKTIGKVNKYFAKKDEISREFD